jgi:single-stranded-DNA-specific exonuclease
MQTRWSLLPPPDKNQLLKLSKELGVSERIAALLLQRNITTYDEAKQFFRPSLIDLHDPYLMKDMHKAVERVERALAAKEKILVYGDYDVDGTTAVALVLTWLQQQGAFAEAYIPDRYKEGYGISSIGVDYAAANGFTLVIALDCGIKAVDRMKQARSMHIDFIICDHHLPAEELPEAYAILDPKQKNCSYPYDELTGCGIGFKLIQALAQRRGQSAEQLSFLLDLVVMSIAADIVPITGENRVLATFGLQQLNSHPRPGFAAILKQVKNKTTFTINDLVFVLAPRINAAGRVEHGSRAVDLLMAKDEGAAVLAGEIANRNNSERRDLDKRITNQAIEQVEGSTDWVGRRSTVVFDPNWHKGVVGIVASRLIERWYRPTIVLTQANGMITGSARSVRDFDVYAAIESCSDLLHQFGGHKYAAGLTLHPENIEAFRDRFEEVVRATIRPEQLIPEIIIDATLALREVDGKLIRLLRQFAPFGPGNMNPVFLAKRVVDRGWARVVGNNHLRLDLSESDQPDRIFPAIGFGLGDYLIQLQNRIAVDACFTIEENEWNGEMSIQLNVKGIRMT